jgi:hypothetical protein
MLVEAERLVARLEKQPWERKRYRADFRDNLATGETITTPTFEVSPTTVPPVVVDDLAIAPEGDQMVMFFGGGVNNTTYRITMKTITSDGQKLEDEIELQVTEF